MDPAMTDVTIEREKLEDVKEAGTMFHCNLFDTEVIHKIAQAFLPGLASACVDNTMGGIFKTPGSVAVDIRKEMVDSLILRSETFVAEAIILEGSAETEVPDHPFDIISDFIDDFSSSKRNFFNKVSGWLLSDRREDRIDDFVQEMELNGFWLIGRRETVAQTLLKNVDFKDVFHCNKKFNSQEELDEHLPQCSFRTINCLNEGCNGSFAAGHMEIHDSICPFKLLPCEQKCSDVLLRREMDRHCITVCPMKLVNCAFYSVGCETTVPQCTLEQHNLEKLDSHMLYIIQGIHKEAELEDLKHRVEQLKKASTPGQLARGRDVRSLAFMIKKLEAKLGPLEILPKPKIIEPEEVPSIKEESTDSPAKKEEHLEDSPSKKEEAKESPTESKSTESPTIKEERVESPTKSKSTESPTKKEDSIESPAVKKELLGSPVKSEEKLFSDSPSKNRIIGSPKKSKDLIEAPAVEKDLSDPPATKEEKTESPVKKEEKKELPVEKNESMDSLTKKEESQDSFTNKDESPSKKEEGTRSPVERELCKESPFEGGERRDLPKESEEVVKREAQT